jgi:LacI family transcriptional regulator, repressor for deo operon, udp, cdd, tsx, nupC, and nupG
MIKKPRRPSHSKARAVKAINIKQVAQAANTSVATVSRTLQMPDVVAAETRKRVMVAIERLGYTPNAQARVLRTARTNMIVALVPDIANPFFAEVIRGIEQIAHRNGYSVLLGDTQYSRVREQAYAELLSSKQADGLITLLPHLPRVSLPDPLPIVNACEYVTTRGVTTVHVDNGAAAEDVTRYLITLGHRDIAFLAGPMHSPICVDRDRGYERGLQQAGIKRNPALTVVGDFSVESGIRCLESLFDARRKFTAVFCSNDEMAMGALRAVKHRGLKVPDDISVVGFDDIRFARYTDPGLTTVAQPKEELGQEAMTLLLDILRGVSLPGRKRILPTQLVVRGSTGRPGA